MLSSEEVQLTTERRHNELLRPAVGVVPLHRDSLFWSEQDSELVHPAVGLVPVSTQTVCSGHNMILS